MPDWAWLVCGLQQGCLDLKIKPVPSGWKSTAGNKEHTLKSLVGKLEIGVEVMWARQATGMSLKGRKGERSTRVLGGKYKYKYIVWGTLTDRHVKICSAWPGQSLCGRDIT